MPKVRCRSPISGVAREPDIDCIANHSGCDHSNFRTSRGRNFEYGFDVGILGLGISTGCARGLESRIVCNADGTAFNVSTVVGDTQRIRGPCN